MLRPSQPSPPAHFVFKLRGRFSFGITKAKGRRKGIHCMHKDWARGGAQFPSLHSCRDGGWGSCFPWMPGATSHVAGSHETASRAACRPHTRTHRAVPAGRGPLSRTQKPLTLPTLYFLPPYPFSPFVSLLLAQIFFLAQFLETKRSGSLLSPCDLRRDPYPARLHFPHAQKQEIGLQLRNRKSELSLLKGCPRVGSLL